MYELGDCGVLANSLRRVTDARKLSICEVRVDRVVADRMDRNGSVLSFPRQGPF